MTANISFFKQQLTEWAGTITALAEALNRDTPPTPFQLVELWYDARAAATSLLDQLVRPDQATAVSQTTTGYSFTAADLAWHILESGLVDIAPQIKALPPEERRQLADLLAGLGEVSR